MYLYFRDLRYEDIPQVLDITKDMWDGMDYIPYLINDWLKDESSLNYGAFKDKNKNYLVGFGRIKFFPNGLAWLEGGRVKPNLQQKGIGRALMNYAIEYAKKAGANVAQYDTSSINLGSLALAKYFGFREKKRMYFLECERNKIKINKTNINNVREISLNEAKETYRELDIGSGNELCIGWTFIPLDFLSDEDSTWLVKNKAILQKIILSRPSIKEIPSYDEIWMITYGAENTVKDLITYTLLNELKIESNKWFAIFCKSEIINFIRFLGFSYETNNPESVILFEKKLS